MKQIACVASLLLVCSALTMAASPIDGGWTGEVGAGDAKQTIQMSLTVEDATLRGSIIGGGEETSIQEGTFNGTILQFKTVQGSGETALKVSCIGSLAGD